MVKKITIGGILVVALAFAYAYGPRFLGNETIVPGPQPAPTGTAPGGGGTNNPPVLQKPEDLIRVSTPKPNDFISNPLTVTGEARGYWFFEASFPIILLDSKGKEVKTVFAQAQSEWMTENFVPFNATITFANPGPGTGTLVLKRDNPSGLPEHDAQVRIPVRFEPPSATGRGDGASMPSCRRTGCSGQICANRDVVTTCEYRTEYACYGTAVCERQPDGQCGWRKTQELTACLENVSPSL